MDLTEAGTPTGQNVLSPPRTLPEGVYFIVSQRPVEVTLIVDGVRQVVRLEAGDQENLAEPAQIPGTGSCAAYSRGEAKDPGLHHRPVR